MCVVGKEAENQSFHSSAKTRNFCCEKETLNVTIQYLRSLKNERLDKKKKKKKKKNTGWEKQKYKILRRLRRHHQKNKK